MHAGLQKGFTLIEMMLAVAILAIIAAIAISYYENQIGEARIGTAIKDIRQAEVILNDLAGDSNLAALDSDTTSLLGLYLDGNGLVLGNPSSTPAGTTPWLDPWDRIYLYQRPAVRNDGGGNLSNATNVMFPQSYDLYSRGIDAASNADDVVRGCNGTFIGLDADHPSC